MQENTKTVIFENKPKIIGCFSIVGPKEGKSPFYKYFDLVLKDDLFDEKSFEKAESKMLEHAIANAIEKAKLEPTDIELLMCGDLLNQTISSNFAARKFDVSYIGLYGACSTMAESIALASCLIDGNFFNNIVCATGSHFSAAERQYRFPLELGNQRHPTSQWTVTGTGATVIAREGNAFAEVIAATFGKVCDFGIKDPNNMGAAMAPAAASTIKAHLKNRGQTPADYDLILTGDLGRLGCEILTDLLAREKIILGQNYTDCGQAFFGKDQQVCMGGSGAGCSAAFLNSFVFDRLKSKRIKHVLFVATGALLSKTSAEQGENTPAIAHAVELYACENYKKGD